MRVAIIDMGTNTFHLMIAHRKERNYSIVYRERQPVKLGMAGINQGVITREAIDRALRCLADFQKTITLQDVDQTLAFGTSALRNSNNGADVIAEIKQATGINASIITGDQEAEYIYRGVRAALNLGTEKSLIMDIGGGSVEFIIGNQTTLYWKQSLEIGAQRLLERFHRHEPILPREIDDLDQFFQQELPSVFYALQQYRPITLVGSSGTFDTLSDIHCIKHDLLPQAHEPEVPLSFTGFYEIYDELILKNREERLLIPGMIEMRVDMIVVACCLIRHLIGRYAFQNIRVSTYALKEGVMASLADSSDLSV